MWSKATQRLLLKILWSELAGADISEYLKANVGTSVASQLYALAKAHDLGHIVASSFSKCGLLGDDDLSLKLKKQEMLSVYRFARFDAELSQVTSLFLENNIPFITLKGSYLREFYPVKSFRTSCDIDILIKEENIDFAVGLLVRQGYKNGERDYHNVTLYSPSDVTLELHFSITENIEKTDKILENAWDYALLKENGAYVFTDEFFVFYFFSHLAYHFLSGGTGLRAFADIWVLKNKMNVDLSVSSELLKQAGIYKFASAMWTLADKCFDDGELDGFYTSMLDFISSGGVYGTVENKVAASKNVGIISYSFKRVFLPFSAMKNIYPKLSKLPFLLPYYWCKRIFTKIFNGKQIHVINEAKTAKSIDKSRVKEIRSLCDRLEID